MNQKKNVSGKDLTYPTDFLNGITTALVAILAKEQKVSEIFKEVCELVVAKLEPYVSSVRILFNTVDIKSKQFSETDLFLKQKLSTADGASGELFIYFISTKFEDGNPQLFEEFKNHFSIWATLINGTLSNFQLKTLNTNHTERLKELGGLNATSEILKRSKRLENSLPEICNILPNSFQYPEFTVARIKYNQHTFYSNGFIETPWKITQHFRCSANHNGTIEVFYTQEFPISDEGPFMFEERNLLINMANLISGLATKDILRQLKHNNTERLKELSAINKTSQIIEQGLTIDETLHLICNLLPKSWQYPEHTACCISYEGKSYTSERFEETDWCQIEYFVTIDNKKGEIIIVYLQEFPNEEEGPFLREERNLLINIGNLITGYINKHKGLDVINKRGIIIPEMHKSEDFRKSLITNKKPLQLYFNQQSIDKYVYLDMMKYKVKHILFVATLYDAFMLENEDSFFEKFMGEIYQYSLFSLPRITGVTSPEEALELLETTYFDLIILMVGIDRETPIALSEKIKEKNESVPVYLLLNRKSDVKYFEDLVPTIRSVDRLFVWNGDSLILFAIVKSIEDRINVENDTKIGLVRVILLIEDSTLYYSRYLQMLYSIVFGQVQHLLPEVEKNELDKICKMRSRPKILHARNYEEAIAIFNKYKDFILCVISDVEFDRAGKADKHAGLKFIEYAKSHLHNLPVILQSSEESNRIVASRLNVTFMNKNSDSLLNDLKAFLISYLGFGYFVFRDEKGNKIAVAKSLREFETLLSKVPDESFYIHAVENQFSLWLMARGEIQLAKNLNPIPVGSFDKLNESRQYILDSIKHYREEKKRGKILSFDETSTLDEKNIVLFGSGSLGGKGRGLAFINTLIYNFDFGEITTEINISTPITVAIGTNEFQDFITRNKLKKKVLNPNISYAELRRMFNDASLSESLVEKLKVFVSQIDKPIAVRSSSISEDSITQPFAGVFDTYILPNCATNKQHILELICSAIKLVYASVYSDDARTYYTAINHRIEEERMAIVLQELVGSYHEDYYYPHISGVAQSYNYYPVANMKPEEGFAVAAIGLGSYVVNGWKSYRFSPYYPKVSVYSIKDLLDSTQVKFYALKFTNVNVDLLENGELAALQLLDISEAEKHGTLKHCASSYNYNNDRIEPGLSTPGPRVINFANILNYNHIPLAETLKVILRTVEEAFGSPVEIEFAVDLNRTKNNLPTFYLLQIKPLVTSIQMQHFDFNKIEKSKMLLYTQSSLGNGEINEISDVIYIDPQKFNKLKTLEMAAEIEKLNKLMIENGKKYILIGPGRWGTRDPFLGIPVNWSQISNAKVIVETSLENYPLDSSLGSHFFHNVTSMNIGYFSVIHYSKTDFIHWETLEKQKLENETQYFRHVRFKKPLQVIMDGKQKTSAIIN